MYEHRERERVLAMVVLMYEHREKGECRLWWFRCMNRERECAGYGGLDV